MEKIPRLSSGLCRIGERDKHIIADLERFRCMTRDDIVAIHFSDVKQPLTRANKALLRLRQRGHISAATDTRRYIYFPARSIKKDSAKLKHFLAIVNVYRQLHAVEPPRVFLVEPKIGGKGDPEPDIFAIWKGAPWYIEVQRSAYTQKQWKEKMNRYEAFCLRGDWKKAEWQPADKKLFPYVWIVGKGTLPAGARSFKVYHIAVEEMIKKIK